MKYWFCCVLLFCGGLVALAGPAAPSIIPLPVLLQTNAGTFTLCPSASSSGLPARATIPILADAPSLTNAQYLAALLLKSTGSRFSVMLHAASNTVKGAILLTTVSAKSSLGTEGYELTVAPDSVVVRAPAEAGIFYGIQSLLQLLPPQIYAQQPATNVAWIAPCVYVLDQPRFSWRGFMMDASRHFFTKQEVKQCLDILAMHKLNTFHWHMNDDQGWRMQELAYPLLTQTGAWRNGINFGLTGTYGMDPRASTDYNPTNGLYGGFYTQADIREVVAYAQQRYITIVPELEMPCHCTATLQSYPQFGCGNAATAYNMTNMNGSAYGVDLLSPSNSLGFVKEVLTEIMGLFPGQYIHCGGDEVAASGDKQWTTYANDKAMIAALGITGSSSSQIIAYQHWFSTNIAAFLHANGRTMIGWTEYEAGGVVPNAALMDWEVAGSGSQAITVAEAGLPVVMAWDNNLYFNYYMISNVAVEPYFEVGNGPAYSTLTNVYGFEPIPSGLPAQYDSNILGAEASAFAELIPSLENLEQRILPRLSALAEIDWTPAVQKNFASFSQRLVTQEQRFSQMGANYDHTNAIQIGTWGPTVAETPYTTNTYNITPYVTGAGEIDIDFAYSTGALNIYSTALLVNGVQVDVDNYLAYAGNYWSQIPVLILHLASFKPGATYTIQTTFGGYNTTSTAGVVYLTNWN